MKGGRSLHITTTAYCTCRATACHDYCGEPAGANVGAAVAAIRVERANALAGRLDLHVELDATMSSHARG